MARDSVVFILLLYLAIVSVLSEKVEYYSDKYDYIDVDELLANDRTRIQYYKCFLETGPCITPDSKFLKEKFPDAFATKCKKCTERQKKAFEKLITYYTEKEPEAWNLIVRKALDNIKKSGK